MSEEGQEKARKSEFKEYPKWVKNSEGNDVIVKDADEERVVTNAPEPEPAKTAEIELPVNLKKKG